MTRLHYLVTLSAILSVALSNAQSADVGGPGYTLSFTPNPDSTTCFLSAFKSEATLCRDVSIPESVDFGSRRMAVTSIGKDDVAPFLRSEKLGSIALPSTVKALSPAAFSLCANLTKVECLAPVPPSLGKASLQISKFGSIDTLIVPASAVEAYQRSEWGREFSAFLPTYTFTTPVDPQSGKTYVSVTNSTTFADAFFAYSRTAEPLSPRFDITLGRSILFPIASCDNLDLKTLNSQLSHFPSAPAFAASLHGREVSNLAARFSGLFNTVKMNGRLYNLVFDDAFLLIDPDSPEFERSEDGKTLYVHIFAGKNYGALRTLGFAGVVAMDAGAKMQKVENVIVTLVGRQGSAGSVRGFLYLRQPQTQPRGVKFLTEAQGVGIDESLASKVAVRSTEPSTGPVRFDPSDTRFRYTTCAFSDAEFASGLVAYWLNFTGVGFSGEYKPTWRQGLEHPEAENNAAKALYKIDFQFDDDSFLTSAPTFANGGDNITISYSKTPIAIKVGSNVIAPGQGQTTFPYVAGETVIVAWKDANFRPVIKAKTPGVDISIKGLLVTVDGAGKQLKGLYTVTGIKICETTGNTLSAPKPGLYNVKVGKRSWKVFVK